MSTTKSRITFVSFVMRVIRSPAVCRVMPASESCCTLAYTASRTRTMILLPVLTISTLRMIENSALEKSTAAMAAMTAKKPLVGAPGLLM